MYRITGTHSIKSAEANTKRRKKCFYGSRSRYEQLQLKCTFSSSYDEFLAVDTLYVPDSLENIFEYSRIILLDSLEDPRNIGSIIRSAAILNYAVLIRRGCGVTETVVKCSAGGVDIIPILEINNLQETIN